MRDRNFRRVSPDTLVAFRILFGVIMLWEVWRYFDRGWIHRYWVEPIDHFKYEGFFWVEPLSAGCMTALFWILGALALFICAGFLYRISTTLFFLIFTYIFLLEQAHHLNHFYLVILLSFLMISVPANRAGSIDTWIRPWIRRATIPLWPVWLLRFQFGIVYLMGGVAKLNRDWLGGSPLNLWLSRRTDFPFVSSLFHLPETALIASWAALLLDLLAFPLLLWRKTRPWAILLLTLFHFTNDRLFSIGIFPWLMTGALTLFLPSNWPRQLLETVRSGTTRTRIALVVSALAGGWIACAFHGGFALIPFLGGVAISAITVWDFVERPKEPGAMDPEWQPQRVQSEWVEPIPSSASSAPSAASARHLKSTRTSGSKRPAGFIRRLRVYPSELILTRADTDPPPRAHITTLAVGLWILLQSALPLRHLVIPGNPSWTEEGHRFAWHMKLRTKSCETRFYTVNPDLVRQETALREEIDYSGYLQPWQERKLQTRPQLIVQFARTLSVIHNNQPVYADAICSLNGNPPKRLIDPEADLTQVRFRDWRRNEWILIYDIESEVDYHEELATEG